MSILDAIAGGSWFQDAPADKNPNAWNKEKVDKKDAENILRDSVIKKVSVGEKDKLGETVYLAKMRVTSKDGTDRYFKVTLYEMEDLEQAAKYIKTMQALAIQIPDSQISRWFDGARFQLAKLPSEQPTALALLRYDPRDHKWMMVASKDRWGIQPMVKEFKADEWFFTFHTDELVTTNGYNEGGGAGPWDQWEVWSKTKPIWELSLADKIGEVDRHDDSWSGWGKWFARGGAHLIDLPVNAAQRGALVLAHDTKSTFQKAGERWEQGKHLKAVGGVIATPFVGALERITNAGQIGLWGVLKMAVPLVNVLNYYTRGSAKTMITQDGMIGKMLGDYGIYLYSHKEDMEKWATVHQKMMDMDSAGRAYDLWLTGDFGPAPLPAELEFERGAAEPPLEDQD